MKVLLTGAAGFIGAHLARLLVDQGCQVHALVRENSDLWRLDDIKESLTFLQGDLISTEQLRTHIQQVKPDLCYHLAWYAEPGVYLNSPKNIAYITATLDLASLLAQAGCPRLVVSGTVAEYDPSRGYLSETSPTGPATLYAAAKVATHTVLSPLAAQLGLEFVWARIFNIYGPYENQRRFIPAVITSMLSGETTKTTPGEQMNDYSHVEDVAAALWAVGRATLTGVVNIGSGLPISNRDIMLKIGALINRPDLIEFGAMPYREGTPMFLCANNHRLLKETNWRPRYDIDSGLQDTVAWWREYLDGN